MDFKDCLRVLPKEEKTKTLRCKARLSSVRLYHRLLRQFSDIILACDKCMRLDDSRYTLSASVSRDFHECQKNRLVAFAKENDESGIVIRSRSIKFNPAESHSMCKYVLNEVGCYFKQHCQFPHSQLESNLWERDFARKISILNFMQDLDRSSLRTERLVVKMANEFSGEFLLLCKACFDKDGKNERKCPHLPKCRQGHGWNDNKVLAFQRTTGKLTVFGNGDEADREIEDSVSRILDYGLTAEDIADMGRRMKQRNLAAMRAKEQSSQYFESYVEDFDMPSKSCYGMSSSEIFDSYFSDIFDPDAFDEDTGDHAANSDIDSIQGPNWTPYYSMFAVDELLTDSGNYREGTIHLQGYFDAVCKVESEDEGISIQIKGRANCGPAFDGDTVCIEVVKTRDREDVKEIKRGTVMAVRKRKIHRCARVFVCTIDRNQSNLMTPLCGSVPKFHTSLKKQYGREKNTYVDVYRLHNETPIWLKRIDLKRNDQEHTLFAVKYLRWDYWCPYPLGYVCKVIQIKKDIDTNQNAINLWHQIDMTDISENDPCVGEYAEYVDNFFSRALIHDQQENLEHLFAFSIDPFWCKCVDDAFSVEKVNINLFQVWVHISDVSHIVEKDDDNDADAQAKGRTFYAADRSKTGFMLPYKLATGVLSLKQGKRRFAISVYFEMDSNGTLRSEPTIMKSVVVNKRQLTYKEAQGTITRCKGANHSAGMHRIDRRIMHLHKLAQKLRARRLNEAHNYYACMSMDDSQDPFGDGQYHDARRLVEEFMILTNQKVAEYLLKNASADLIPLRQQRKPTSAKLNVWLQRHGVIRSLSFYFDQFKNVDEFHSTLSPSLESIALLQSSWTAFKDAVEAEDAEKIRVIVGSEQRHPNHCLAIADWWDIQEPAIFSTSADNPQHFDLHLPHYVKFTSPIRRYMDIVVHRLVTDIIRYRDIYTYTSDEIQAICEKANQQKQMSRSYKQSCELLLMANKLKFPHFLPCFVKKLTPFFVLLEVPYLIKTKMKELTLSYSALGVNGLRDQVPQNIGSTDHYSQVTLVWSKRYFDISGHRTTHARETSHTEHPYQLNPEIHGKRIQDIFWKIIQEEIVKDRSDRDFIKKIAGLVNLMELCNVDASSDFVTDVTSELKEGKMLINHYVSFSLTLEPGSIIPVQFVGEIGRALLEPEIKMINLTKSKDVCVEHRKKPVKCFLNSSIANSAPQRYRDLLDYIETWRPILGLEAVTSAVSDEDSVLCSSVPISFKTVSTDEMKCRVLCGNLKLPFSFCVKRQIKVSMDCREADFMHDFLCIRSEETEDNFSEFKRNVWTCHAVTVSAKIIKDEDVVSLRFKVTSYSVAPPVKLLDGREHPCTVELLYRTLPNK